MSELVERIKNRFRWAAYSPRLHKIILLDGGRTKLEGGKDFYTYADEFLFGKYMNADRLEKDYTICWEID